MDPEGEAPLRLLRKKYRGEPGQTPVLQRFLPPHGLEKAAGGPAVSRGSGGGRRLGELAEAYFTACAGEPALDGNGEPLADKNGRPILVGERPPTPAGLALALGFCSVEELTGYSGPREAERALRRALLRCRAYAEERLYDKDSRQGAEFTLKAYFGAAAPEEAAGGGVVVLPEVTMAETDPSLRSG